MPRPVAIPPRHAVFSLAAAVPVVSLGGGSSVPSPTLQDAIPVFDENPPDHGGVRIIPRILRDRHQHFSGPAGLRDTIHVSSPFQNTSSPKSLSNPNRHPSMIRILSAVVLPVFAMFASSCCCTSDSKPPGLRPLPQFQEIPSSPGPAAAPRVYGTK
jgi:hypothetical protein